MEKDKQELLKFKVMTKLEEIRKRLSHKKVYLNGKGTEVLDILNLLGMDLERSVDINVYPFIIIGEKIKPMIDMNVFKNHPYKEIVVDEIINTGLNSQKPLDVEVGDVVITNSYHCFRVKRVFKDKRVVSGYKTNIDIANIRRLATKEEVENLEKREKSTLFSPYQKVLVRDDKETDAWRATLFSHYAEDSNNMYPYVTVGGVYRMCIPYEGNENKIGKK